MCGIVDDGEHGFCVLDRERKTYVAVPDATRDFNHRQICVYAEIVFRKWIIIMSRKYFATDCPNGPILALMVNWLRRWAEDD